MTYILCHSLYLDSIHLNWSRNGPFLEMDKVLPAQGRCTLVRFWSGQHSQDSLFRTETYPAFHFFFFFLIHSTRQCSSS